MNDKIISKIEVETKHLLSAYSAIEKARRELYWALNYQIRAGEEPIKILPTDDVKTEILDNGNSVKLTIMDYPSRLQTTKREERERWTNNITFALRKVKTEVSFDRIFVFTRFYFPAKNTDVDNYDISPIINGIKYSGLVPDDIYKYVSFGFDAVFSKNPKTEIYIVKYNKLLPEILTKILSTF
ncbi:hypothetical protein SAMN04244560_00104 [Thermoanaerobacter thermohydrosulfuricus]|uniref:Uncharacterized protein n=1 Tax=Thermoanaerobacter thermohydrosulfuricus TaxID=1516 RepID=A0A1G7HML6_THETY|nr:hypothetical protein [Thermoanaerobacter thermohydrosulfuricus]SDF01613.1 hypothetical protein SAMN04244560_00104 [Thermoanaerobacter thermohydrosulfuricus]SFE01168.1 hypothetical protein SAMN04324257_00182 [Thermoanaerobacter thermohydrosulfuricus]